MFDALQERMRISARALEERAALLAREAAGALPQDPVWGQDKQE